jgi:hypothetical protein
MNILITTSKKEEGLCALLGIINVKSRQTDRQSVGENSSRMSASPCRAQ